MRSTELDAKSTSSAPHTRAFIPDRPPFVDYEMFFHPRQKRGRPIRRVAARRHAATPGPQWWSCGPSSALRVGSVVGRHLGILASFDPPSAMALVLTSLAGAPPDRGDVRVVFAPVAGCWTRSTVAPWDRSRLRHEMLKAIPASVTAQDFERHAGATRRRVARAAAALSSWTTRGARTSLAGWTSFIPAVLMAQAPRRQRLEYLDLVNADLRSPVVMKTLASPSTAAAGPSSRGSIAGTTGRIVLAGRNLVAGLPALQVPELVSAAADSLLGLPVTDLATGRLGDGRAPRAAPLQGPPRRRRDLDGGQGLSASTRIPRRPSGKRRERLHLRRVARRGMR